MATRTIHVNKLLASDTTEIVTNLQTQIPNPCVREYVSRVLTKIPKSYAVVDNYYTSTVYIMLEGYPFSLGYLSYTEKYHGGKYKFFYEVHSDQIYNERGDKNVKRSTSRSTAVKNASTFLRKVGITRWVNENIGIVIRKSRDAQTIEKNKLNEITAEMGFKVMGNQDMQIIDELVAVHNNGHHFSNLGIRQNIDKLVSAYYALLKARENLPTRFIYVLTIDVDTEHPKLITADTGEFQVNVFNDAVIPNVESNTIKVTDAPSDLLEKLSVLSMLEDKSYMEDIGYKHHEGIYYVLPE